MLCLALIMGFTTFTFAGCSDGGNNTGSGGSVSSSGDGTTNSGGGTSGGGSTSGGNTTPIVTEPQLKTMGTYFSGIRAEYEKTNFLNQNNQTKTFEQLLDQQFQVLAQDLLCRLEFVYGEERIDISTGTHDFNVNYKLQSNSVDYSYNGNSAIVSSSNLLINNQCAHASEFYINCVGCYQKSLLIDMSSSNLFFNLNNMFLPGAVNGKYTTLNAFQLKDEEVDENKWNYAISSNSYITNVKMALAQIVCNIEPTGEFTETAYNNILSNISKLGFNASELKDKISQFILKKVIGENVVNKDNLIYNSSYFNEKGYKLDSAFLVNAPYPGNSNYTETENANSPRLYKGYNIVVPAIVEQALKNTFDGTTTSLYPKLNRYAIETSNSVGGLSGAKAYRSIVLMPKTNTPTTKLVLEVAGSADTIGKTISIGYDIVIAGTKYSGSKNVTLAATATEVELNLNSITGGAKLNAYDGSTASYSQTLLFGNNNEFDSSGNSTNNNGNNYIKLNFVGQDGGSFMVNFRGLYDKV